ncbi:MAG TPA: HAMP domain-containing sensor histidine kinase [Gaiellaceae bacterium]|nr:HAMP domain-containing sensor histidine kinase [Gaiellaceae bacterium]
MFSSLRFRLPALFLAGIALTGLVSTLIAFGLFRNYTQDQAKQELRREAAGLTQLYAAQARGSQERGTQPPLFAASKLEAASGNRLFYTGLDIFSGQATGLTKLPRRAVDWSALEQGETVEFEFTPPGEDRNFLAVSHPLYLDEGFVGALTVATPEAQLSNQAMRLIARLALALAVGLIVTGFFAWYLSGRITGPVRRLAKAADEVAEGRYDTPLPEVAGRDEIADLADSFRQMTERLAEAEELERNFLMTVSHELRTPLTAIRGHVEALREGVVEDPELRTASLDVIAAEAGRLERLVGDVLDLAKLDTRRFTVLREEVDMARLLDRAHGVFAEEAKRRGIDYEQEVESEPVIVSDGDRVLQIITNLLANAFRWTPDGGRVDLRLRSENGRIYVAVEDNGPGIGPDEQERIFRPFWTHDGKGTGLGLAIARELALALGGQIELESQVGRGSRFELVLPAQLN